MKKLKAMLWVAVCVAALVMSAGKVQAQGRGNVDPAQRRQERIDALRDKLDVKDDAEWKLIEAAIGKVYDAGREVMGVRMR
ncbi:MAG TPA: hypothetical protein VG754_14445, partial [Verrucomicrobiae bacterium]|nr:hypothetical protein [Verrucomicrobiae bacterium]